MLRRLRRHLTPSFALSIIAIVIACAGSATAATLITGKQIKNSSITAADIRDQSLTGSDIKNRSISMNDIKLKAISAQAIEPATVQQLQETPATSIASKVEPAQSADGRWLPVAVMCPEGQIATGGGGGFVTNPVGDGRLGRSRPVIVDGKPRGWEVAGVPPYGYPKVPGGGSDQIEVYAICSP